MEFKKIADGKYEAIMPNVRYVIYQAPKKVFKTKTDDNGDRAIVLVETDETGFYLDRYEYDIQTPITMTDIGFDSYEQAADTADINYHKVLFPTGSENA